MDETENDPCVIKSETVPEWLNGNKITLFSVIFIFSQFMIYMLELVFDLIFAICLSAKALKFSKIHSVIDSATLWFPDKDFC